MTLKGKSKDFEEQHKSAKQRYIKFLFFHWQCSIINFCDNNNWEDKPGMRVISAFYHYMVTFMEP